MFMLLIDHRWSKSADIMADLTSWSGEYPMLSSVVVIFGKILIPIIDQADTRSKLYLLFKFKQLLVADIEWSSDCDRLTHTFCH